MENAKHLLQNVQEKRNISQSRLCQKYHLNGSQIDRLKKDEYVSPHTVELLCKVLDCSEQDIAELQ